MTRVLIFAGRNLKELLRDRLSLLFSLGFPLVVLLLLTAIQRNIPVPLFALDCLTPGIAVFGLSFIALFSGQLISKDRSGAFMTRLLTSPMGAWDFILGYTLPLLPLALGQSAVCYLAALLLGLPLSVQLLPALLLTLPSALLFIGLGLLCGTLLNDKQVGGICGALLTNLTAWLSGTWFDLSLVGGGFQRAADLLPFAHGVDLGRAALTGDLSTVLPHLFWVLGYALAVLALAVFLFSRKVRRT